MTAMEEMNSLYWGSGTPVAQKPKRMCEEDILNVKEDDPEIQEDNPTKTRNPNLHPRTYVGQEDTPPTGPVPGGPVPDTSGVGISTPRVTLGYLEASTNPGGGIA